MRASLRTLPLLLLLSSSAGCAVEEPATTTGSFAAEVENGDFTIWRSNKGLASVREIVIGVKQLAVQVPTDARLTEALLHEGVRDLEGHLYLLEGLVGVYLHEVIAHEERGESLDRLRAAYGKTPLAAYLDFDAFLADRRMNGAVLMHADAVESWAGTITYTGLEAHGQADYDDDGDLDLFLVNAPGGDNALEPDGAHQVATAPASRDLDGDGELELVVTATPQRPPSAVIALITPAIR